MAKNPLNISKSSLQKTPKPKKVTFRNKKSDRKFIPIASAVFCLIVSAYYFGGK